MSSIHAVDAGFALDVQSLESLKHKAAKNPQAALKQAAQQFEAIFIQVMLKSMRDAIPESGLMTSKETEFYDSLMDQQWSQELAKRGIGLADQLVAQLSRTLPTAGPTEAALSAQAAEQAADSKNNEK